MQNHSLTGGSLHAGWLAASPAAINFLTLKGDLLWPPAYALAACRPTATYRWYCVAGLDLIRVVPAVPGIDSKGCGIDRRHISTLSRAQFMDEYEKPNRPVVIQGLAEQWPASQRWKLEAFVRRYGDLSLKTNGRCSKGRRYRLKCFDFLSYCDGWNGEKPLYIFDKKLVSEVCPELINDYTVPEFFRDDLFELMSDCDRPDYRWLLLGPSGSGSPFHQDPHGTSAWNAVFEGCKRFSFYPPEYVPPGVDETLIDSDYYAGDDTMEWYRERMPGLLRKGKSGSAEECIADASRARKIPRRRDRPPQDRPPMECYVHPGEILFIPSGWWHQVQNIGHTIAVTQNYCSHVTFPLVATDMNRFGGRAVRKDFKAALLRSGGADAELAGAIQTGRKYGYPKDWESSSSSSSSSSSYSSSSCEDSDSSDGGGDGE